MESYIISHSKSGYNSDEKISELITDRLAASTLKAFINKSVTYGDLEEYISDKVNTYAFKSCKGYSVLSKSKWDKDDRNFIKTKVSVCKSTQEMISNLDVSGCDIFRNQESVSQIMLSILISLGSAKSTVYFIVPNEDLQKSVRGFIAKYFSKIISQISYIETVGILPEPGYANVVTCCCINPEDRQKFYNQLGKVGSILKIVVKISFTFNVKH